MTLDPFFDEFHQRMPDVRVVLLPPAGPQPVEPVEHMAPEEAARLATTARTTAKSLLASLWAVASAGRPQPPETRYDWDAGESAGIVLAQGHARCEGPVGDVRGDLTSVREQLTADGWTVTARRVGEHGARLAGVRGDVRLGVVVWGPDGPWDVAVSVPASVGDQATAVRATGDVTTPRNTPAPEVTL
jgi:hypothetical protein